MATFRIGAGVVTFASIEHAAGASETFDASFREGNVHRLAAQANRPSTGISKSFQTNGLIVFSYGAWTTLTAGVELFGQDCPRFVS